MYEYDNNEIISNCLLSLAINPTCSKCMLVYNYQKQMVKALLPLDLGLLQPDVEPMMTKSRIYCYLLLYQYYCLILHYWLINAHHHFKLLYLLADVSVLQKGKCINV